MDGVLAILLIPLLLAGLILVLLNMLDVDISLSKSTDDDELSEMDKHKASTAHTDMLNVTHNSSIGAHSNFDDKYINLLKSGGSKKYNELFSPFNLNLSKKSFWKKGLNVIESFIDELETL